MIKMARHYEPSEDDVREWNAWVAKRPEHVRKVAERFQPWTLYKLKPTGQRVTIYSFGEHESSTKVTLTIYVSGMYNFVMIDSCVFGIDPDDLEECDLPGPEEALGAACETEEDELTYVNGHRELNNLPPLTLEELNAYRTGQQHARVNKMK
jgi:hypothetical protein